MIRIALDAMGGDYAPRVPVEGAFAALGDLPESCEILLVGRQAEVEAAVAVHGALPGRFRLVDAPDVVGMGDKPLAAVRGKPKSSIAIGLGLHKRGEADAFISAGNTGAVMAASTILLGLHPGVERPAIATLFPTGARPVLVLDAGANVDCSARELQGFAHIGALYARDVLGRANPAVGLLNIGEEEEKGNTAVKEAYDLLRPSTHFRFLGNIEGRDILKGECDVVVCDGFVGNVVLKFYESIGAQFRSLLESAMDRRDLDTPSMRRVFKILDHSEYGGAPLLGIRGVSIICHGSSPPRAVQNAIQVAIQAVQSQLSQHIGAEFAGGEAVA